MKNYTLPANNAVRRFRYYQKLAVLRESPKAQFGLEIEKYGDRNKSTRSINK